MSGIHFVLYSHAHLQKMSSRIRIVAPSSGVLKMETSDKNGYQLMHVAYHIDFDGCINQTTGCRSLLLSLDLRMVMWLWLCSPEKTTL